MSSDDENDTAHGHRMAFSSENDFKGGRWVNGEFFCEEQRKGHRQTKDEATSGVFDAGGSSGSDDDGGGSSGDDVRSRY